MYKPEHKKSNQTIARLKKQGKNYEILVDCEIALKVRTGEARVEDALLLQKIFKDARTGDVQGELEQAFGTNDPLKIAEEIIKNGDVQLSEEYRKKVLEEKKNKILEQITKKAADPQTHYPIPRQRIELGMEKAGYKIRLEKSVPEQVKELMEILVEAMPITFKDIIVTVNSPPQFTAQVYSIVKKSGEMIDQNYQPDGSLLIKVKIAAGRKNELNKGGIRVNEKRNQY
jgi:ribosome maturation protein SDO1